MATELEVIRKLCYQVDNYDEQQELLQSSEELSGKMGSNPQQHIQLCSPDTNCTTISAYIVTIHQEHGITDFLGSLSLFFERNSLESDVYSYKVSVSLRCRISCINGVGYILPFLPSHL